LKKTAQFAFIWLYGWHAIICGVYVIEWANLAATRDGRGTRSDVILGGSDLAGCMVVSSRVSITYLG